MQYYDKPDQIAFDRAELGDPSARATLLRIVQRDPSPQKRECATGLLAKLDPQAPQPGL
jgi:hypothetical protein